MSRDLPAPACLFKSVCAGGVASTGIALGIRAVANWLLGAPGRVLTFADWSEAGRMHIIYPGSLVAVDDDGNDGGRRVLMRNIDRARSCHCGRSPCARAVYTTMAHAPNHVFYNAQQRVRRGKPPFADGMGEVRAQA
jgi:hypothetical protein